MAFTAQSVIQAAQRSLQDPGAVRWSLPELLDYLNAGLREIAIAKPNATSVNHTLTLVEGTKQTLPEGFHRLLSVIHNVANGSPVKPTDRETLDTEIPGWHDQRILPRSATARYVADDMDDPSVFYVCPGNDGTGEIVATLSAIPARIPTPASPDNIASYSASVPIGDIYENCLVDYVLYRAFAKDINVQGAAGRAQAHFALFQQSLGIKKQNEATENVDKPKNRFSQ